jgi:hypothetical protein
MLVVNKRGVSKTALVDPPNRSAKWTSRYGSLTFNQFGREFPSGGTRANRALIEKSYRGVDFLRATPVAELDAAAAYPETTSCAR